MREPFPSILWCSFANGMQLGFSRNITPLSKKHIPARDPKQCGGSRKIMHIHVDGGDDDDGDVCDDGEVMMMMMMVMLMMLMMLMMMVRMMI